MDRKLKKILYKTLLKYHKQLKEKEIELDKYEILLNSDDITFNYKTMNPDENWWIKPPYPCNKDFKSEYYEELVKKLKEEIKTIEYKYNKLHEKLDIKTDIYDRIFYYKYLEELEYKALLKKIPYSESRFNDYYKTVKEIINN